MRESLRMRVYGRKMRGPIVGLMLLAGIGSAEVCCGATFTYEIEVQIRYDVTETGVILPDTEVWGMPLAGQPSGTIDLDIDEAGNVVGTTPVDPGTQLGLLSGELVYSADRNTWCQITDASWGTPVGRIAPLTGGTIDLTGNLLGDFNGLTITTGFIEDGNSGDFFYMGNGIGLDGKLEFTAIGPDGVSLDFRSKGMSGYGTGTYMFGVDTGSITYTNGTDLFNKDLKGVTAFYLEVDHIAQTFQTSAPQVLLEDNPSLWWHQGRRIDSFGGAINPAGNFAGTAHYMGTEFISMDFISGNGIFQDGNSAGFDISNGLVLGDSLTVVLTDQSGLFDLVIIGTLISLPEICNGIDDDGDGDVDEDLGQATCGLGECLHTIDNCVAGVPQVCDPMEGASIEICDDGLDNDCDGLTDPNDPDCLDSDGDGVPYFLDNCPSIPNGPNLGTCSPGSGNTGAQCTSNSQCNGSCGAAAFCSIGQEDVDSDGWGDVCDNCPDNCNDQQLDADDDGEGDVCDLSPGCGGCGPPCEQEC